MNQKIKEELFATWHDAWVPPDNSEINEWANKHVQLSSVYAIPGKFSADRSRYMIEPLKALRKHSIRQVNLMASPRCGKTLIAELFLNHTIANNAGTFLWLQSSDEMMDKLAELRLLPLLKSCGPVSDLINTKDKFSITKKRFKFPHMTVNLAGAKIRALQSIGYKFIVGDECWLWDKGFIGEAQARTIDFQHTSKLLFLSQGGFEGDDWSTEFDKAPVYEWGWVCPKCNKEQTLHWNKLRDDGTYSGIIWEKNNITCPDGVWNYAEAGKTAKLECHFCNHQLADNPQNRRYLNDKGVYVCTKSNGDPKKVSFRWNALANIEIAFGDLVVEYLQAKHILAREGNKIPLQEFHQKRLAKSFNQNLQAAVSKIILAEYNPSEAWGDKKFMTVDAQSNLNIFPYVIRAWKKNGESRLIKYGKAPSFAEIRKIQLEHGIRDQCVLIDSGNMATQIYAKCVEYSHVGMVGGKKHLLSWIALKGFDQIDFQHTDGTRKLYSPETRGDPNLGQAAQKRTCPLYKWSNYSVKQMLVHLRDGKGVAWLANDVDQDYTNELNSEVLTRTIDKKTNKEKWIFVKRTATTKNDYFDCECMQIVAALMANFLGNIGGTPSDN